ncbi:hypothetical protein [Lentisalinibacter orientalis]|uniref:hypothetical protein n=1 Tax=Lentisalinibacter orientalis TaxID=2992241 RepID=UPI00386B029D
MTIRLLASVLGTLFLMAGCAANNGGDPAVVAQTDSAAAGETRAAGGAADEPQLICKEIVKTGTRFSEKVCATKEAWDGAAEHGRRATEEIQRRPVYEDGQNPVGGG